MTTPNQTFRFVPVKAATSVKLYNIISPTTAENEFSQALTSGTKQLMIRCRSRNTLKIAFESIDTESKWITVSPNTVYSKSSLDFTGTLYMKTDGSEIIIEVEEWS